MPITPAIAAFTQREEGGYTDDPRDAGNWSSGVTGHGRLIGSNLGIGAPAALAWMHPREDTVTPSWMRNSAASIWLPLASTRYWRPLSGDVLHPAVAAMCFDYGWNRGPANAARALQAVLGVSQDGDLGPMTLLAVRGRGDLPSLLSDLSDAQEAAYRDLANFGIYGRGWLARTGRRLALARSLAGISPSVALHAGTAPLVRPVPVVSPQQSEADALDSRFNPQVSA